jgi:hypothetical protein
MDPAAFSVLINTHVRPVAVWRVLMRDIAHPALFRRFIDGMPSHLKSVIEPSRCYVRYLRRYAYIEPGCSITIRLYLDAGAKVAGLILSYDQFLPGHPEFQHGVSARSYSKDELTQAAQGYGVRVRPSWTRKRIWQEIIRSGPNAEQPRFKRYLTHRIENGRVVAEERRVD